MSQRDLLIEVLRRFDEKGVLTRLIVIGSWCVPLYESYFRSSEYPLSLRTRDVDFLIPGPIPVKVDIAQLLEDLGFVVTWVASGDLEIMPRVFYQPRGSTITLEDGRTILFMGGADSIDKERRTLGESWFPEEVISEADLLRLPDTHVDIVISHTCPEELVPTMLEEDPLKSKDPSTRALSYVLERYKPKLWYFGHWHTYAESVLGDCRWYCLNMAEDLFHMDRIGWWRWLDDRPSEPGALVDNFISFPILKLSTSCQPSSVPTGVSWTMQKKPKRRKDHEDRISTGSRVE